MLPSLREDYLEAILLYTNRHPAPPSCQDIASALHLPEPDVSAHLAELAAAGDLTISGTGAVVLSETGRETGQRVIKKHETLQCFLSEILGMDSSSASYEACTLEHAISDETIDRLGQLMVKQDGQWHRGRGRHGRQDSTGRCMAGEEEGQYPSISDCSEGENVIIQCIQGRACAKRLLDLGMVPGERASIKRKLSNGALVVQVKGCDVALSPEIASAIGVERSP